MTPAPTWVRRVRVAGVAVWLASVVVLVASWLIGRPKRYVRPPDLRPEEMVCPECFADRDVEWFLRSKAPTGACSYCVPARAAGVSLDDLVDWLLEEGLAGWTLEPTFGGDGGGDGDDDLSIEDLLPLVGHPVAEPALVEALGDRLYLLGSWRAPVGR